MRKYFPKVPNTIRVSAIIHKGGIDIADVKIDRKNIPMNVAITAKINENET